MDIVERAALKHPDALRFAWGVKYGTRVGLSLNDSGPRGYVVFVTGLDSLMTGDEFDSHAAASDRFDELVEKHGLEEIDQ